VYFHQFVERAGRHGLRYLGEARLTTMVLENFTPEVRKALETVADDQAQAEQYLDFVRNRTFRETRLVHADQQPQWGIRPAAVEGLHVAASRQLTEEPGDVRSAGAVQYRTATGMVLSTSSPVLKAALKVLAAAWPGTVPFADLYSRVIELLGTERDERDSLALALLNAYLSTDLLDLHAMPIPAGRVGDRPLALASVRVGLALGERTAATARHDLFRANELDAKLLPLLDGTRDRAALLDALTDLTLHGELTVQADGRPLADAAAIREALGPVLEKTLAAYANAGVLSMPTPEN
jgi:methyltransferase-like protein